MKRALVFIPFVMMFDAWSTMATEYTDTQPPPGAPAPHIAPPGAGNVPKPITTNTTPVTGVSPATSGTPQREVQPGTETPQVEELKPVVGNIRPPRGGVVEDKDGGTGGGADGGADGGGSGGGSGAGSGGGSPDGGSGGGSNDNTNPYCSSEHGCAYELEDGLEIESQRVRGVDTPLSTGQGPQNMPGDPQSGQAAPPQNPLKNQMKGSAAGTLPTKSSSLPEMPTPAGNNKQSGVNLFPDKQTDSGQPDGLSKTPPTSAPAAVGQLSKPAREFVTQPALKPVAKGPGAIVVPRENCGTYWTAWVDDPNTNVNPCPSSCERGERQVLNHRKSGDTEQYQARYQCYLPEIVVNQKPSIARQIKAGGVKGANCGTHWTGWQSDLDTDINPCPTNCERGELQVVNRNRSDQGMQYDMRYQCYVAEPQSVKAAAASSAQALFTAPQIQSAKSALAKSLNTEETTSPEKQSSGKNTVQTMTGMPIGRRVANDQTATSTSVADTAPAASALKRPAVAEREISTRNVVPGPTLLAVTGQDATTVRVSWRPLVGASDYQAHAAAQGLNYSVAGQVVRQPVLDGANQPGLPSAITYDLSGIAPGVEHNVWVTVNYPDGRAGASEVRTVTTSSPENPVGFMAFPIVLPGIPGAVRLEWQPRRGATGYMVEGSNMPRTQTTNTTFIVPDIRTVGTHAWTVIAVYPGGVYDDRNAPSASVTCVLSESDQRVVCTRDRNP